MRVWNRGARACVRSHHCSARAGLAIALIASAAVPSTAFAATAARTGPPNSMTVLGDSISAGTGTAGIPGSEQKNNSWASGGNTSVNSYFLRLKALRSTATTTNQSANGKKMSDAAGQASSMPQDTELVLIEMGGNDLCKDTVDQMTSISTYRNQFVATLNAIQSRNPNALTLVASIPDIFNLWFLRGAPAPPQDIVSSRAGTARTFWDTLGVIPCKSLVDNPTDMSAAGNSRRWQVRDRTIAFNAILKEECEKRLRCRYDNDSLFTFSSNRIKPFDNAVDPFSPTLYASYLPRAQWQFLDDDISTIDHFHPSLAGHTKVARVAWENGYDWTDSTAPSISSTSISPAPLTTSGIYRNKPTVTINYGDAAGIKGIEYRVDTDGSPGAWSTTLAGSVAIDPIKSGPNTIETRAMDRNGNLSASQSVVVNWDPNATAVSTAPQSVATSQASYRQVRVSWSAPADDGATPITGYTVERSSDGGSTWADALGSSTTGTSAVVTGLSPATAYRFRVKATNAAGTSAASSEATATTRTLTVPNLPTGFSGTSKAGSVDLSWTAPEDDGGQPITSYTVTASPQVLGATRSCTTATTGCTVTGLVNGTEYSFTLTATNSIGTTTALDADAAVTPLAAPNAPFITLATGGSGQASIQWNAPDSDGGRPVTSYTVTASPQVGGLTRTCSTTPPTTGCTVTGLANGTTYRFTVTATNEVGTSPASGESTAVTPRSVPGIPVISSALASDRSVAVSWSAPTNGGAPITLYTVTASPTVDGVARTCTTTSETDTSCTVTGLKNGTGYSFTVTATNSQGTSPASVAAGPVTPKAVPGSPTAVKATAGNGNAAVSWTAPTSSGGSSITGYAVTASPTVGGTARTCSTTGAISCTVTGLTNGTAYRFTVTAANSAGDGLPSPASDPVTPVGPPGRPSVTTVVGGDGTATVSWSAPADDGGSQLNGYTVSASPAVAGVFRTCSTALNLAGLATSCTVTGLVNGTEYTFTVGASNRAGLKGLPSTISDPVTPATVPGAPFVTSAVAGNGLVTVQWNPPTSNGGAPVLSYTVTASPTVGGATRSCTTSGAASCQVTGLVNGTAYTFTVTATNRVGAGAPSAASVPATPVLPLPTTVSAKTGTPVLTSSAVTTITAVTAPRAGKITLTGKLKQGSKTLSVCTVNRTVTGFGTVNLTCKGSSSVRSALKKAAGVLTLTTAFSPTTGAASQVVETINIPKKA